MSKTLTLSSSTEQGLLDVLGYLLENKKVAGVFTLKKLNKNGDISYALITKKEELATAVPLYPVMPVNAGSLLSQFSVKGSPNKPVVAVVKPCELRGFVERVKREQGSVDNILIISTTCGGVYPSQTIADASIHKKIKSYWDAVKKGETPGDCRPACKGCVEFIPYTADITVDLIGNGSLDTTSTIYLNSKQAEQMLDGIKGKLSDSSLDTGKYSKIRSKREVEEKALFGELDKKLTGLDGLIDLFGRCINCHGCSRVCPICYCKLCEFESPDSEYKPAQFDSELKKRGALRVPPGTIYYHLGRLTHIGISCVGCGCCEDVCPVDIPLSILFKKVGEDIQQSFEYIPGKDCEEKIPLVTFEKVEFTDIEE